MKHLFLNLMMRWNVFVLPAQKLGFWGVWLVALIDSSSLPVPMDFILGASVWADKSHFWVYCLMGATGSAIGGLVPYGLGRAGGELFLLKRVNRQRFEELRVKFERQEFLAVLVPSMLPPPTPWKLFVIASGVFEMRVPTFMLAVFLGRLIRWMVLSLLVLKLGQSAVTHLEALIKAHMAMFLGALAAIFVAIGLWIFLKAKKRRPAEGQSASGQ